MSLGEINTETRSCRLAAGHNAYDLRFKKATVPKSKEVKEDKI
jgi:hypothetical protein